MPSWDYRFSVLISYRFNRFYPKLWKPVDDSATTRGVTLVNTRVPPDDFVLRELAKISQFLQLSVHFNLSNDFGDYVLRFEHKCGFLRFVCRLTMIDTHVIHVRYSADRTRPDLEFVTMLPAEVTQVNTLAVFI